MSRGISSDPIPYRLLDKVPAENYGGFREKGVGFVRVHYFELWLRPKLILPIPFVEPYLVLPVGSSFGGMQGYSVFGVGFGALAGVQVPLASFKILAESGFVVRSRKGVSGTHNGPPWGMSDLSIPITLGLGYSF